VEVLAPAVIMPSTIDEKSTASEVLDVSEEPRTDGVEASSYREYTEGVSMTVAIPQHADMTEEMGGSPDEVAPISRMDEEITDGPAMESDSVEGCSREFTDAFEVFDQSSELGEAGNDSDRDIEEIVGKVVGPREETRPLEDEDEEGLSLRPLLQYSRMEDDEGLEPDFDTTGCEAASSEWAGWDPEIVRRGLEAAEMEKAASRESGSGDCAGIEVELPAERGEEPDVEGGVSVGMQESPFMKKPPAALQRCVSSGSEISEADASVATSTSVMGRVMSVAGSEEASRLQSGDLSKRKEAKKLRNGLHSSETTRPISVPRSRSKSSRAPSKSPRRSRNKVWRCP
jgi:hypothetical protein